MIQRIQSVYLLLVAVISVVMLFVPIEHTELIDLRNYVYALEIFIGASAFVTIFLYKRRKHQIKHCWLLIILQIIILGFYFLFFSSPDRSHYYIGAYLLIVSIILCFLAKRAIKKDDELVRSADRLR